MRRVDAGVPVDAKNAPTGTWKTAQHAVSHSAHTHHCLASPTHRNPDTPPMSLATESLENREPGEPRTWRTPNLENPEPREPKNPENPVNPVNLLNLEGPLTPVNLLNR